MSELELIDVESQLKEIRETPKPFFVHASDWSYITRCAINGLNRKKRRLKKLLKCPPGV